MTTPAKKTTEPTDDDHPPIAPPLDLDAAIVNALAQVIGDKHADLLDRLADISNDLHYRLDQIGDRLDNLAAGMNATAARALPASSGTTTAAAAAVPSTRDVTLTAADVAEGRTLVAVAAALDVDPAALLQANAATLDAEAVARGLDSGSDNGRILFAGTTLRVPVDA